MRTLVIGDIHGAYNSLIQVLERSGFDPKVDRLIQIGDVADGWEDTFSCVEKLLEIQKQATKKNQPIFIRGNHDAWVNEWFKTEFNFKDNIWLSQGGKATVKSYEGVNLKTLTKHAKFFDEQLDYFVDKEMNLYIHAGFNPRYGFENGVKKTVWAGVAAIDAYWDRELWKKAKMVGNINLSTQKLKETSQFNKVFIGHTASRNAVVEKYTNVINTDSGAGWAGRLSITDVDTEQTWYADDAIRIENGAGRFGG